MSYSDNAIMAKVRARYGRRLLEEDYKQLLACHSVGEITAYLKTRPGYRTVLAEVQEDTIHRGQLENLIRRRILNIYTRLLKYSYGDRLFMDLYVFQSEMAQLLLAMRYLNAGEMDRYIVSLPVYLAKFMRFDLFALAKVRDFDGLLDLLERNRECYEIVGRFRPYASGLIDIVGCERALKTHYYELFIRRVEKDYEGKTRDDLLSLLYWQIDFHNINVIYRLKRYFGYKPERVRENLINLKSNLSTAMCERLIMAEDADGVLALMKEIRGLRGLLDDLDFDAVHIITQMDHVRLRQAQRPFRYSNRPVVVVVAYMTILELELSNLVNIIEGVRYGVTPDEILQLLVF
jgi:V/A-type H+-transporting ATPase subunit C